MCFVIFILVICLTVFDFSPPATLSFGYSRVASIMINFGSRSSSTRMLALLYLFLVTHNSPMRVIARAHAAVSRILTLIFPVSFPSFLIVLSNRN